MITIKQKYLATLSQTLTEKNESREKAIAELNTIDFPEIKAEYWKHTPIAKWLPNEIIVKKGDKKIKHQLFDAIDAYKINFQNGFLTDDFRSVDEQNLVILKSEEATTKHPEIFKRHLEKKINWPKEIFATLNTAFYQSGIFIYVKKNAEIKQPIIITQNNTDDQIMAMPKIMIYLETGAQLNLILKLEDNGAKNTFSNICTESILEENSSLNIEKIQKIGSSENAICTERFYQEKNSQLKINTFCLSGNLLRNNLSIQINGENCHTSLNGLVLPKDKAHFDNHTRLDHAKANCQSHQLYKSIVAENATSVFNGKIMVHRDAQKINAFQSNANVLLSEQAHSFSKPELEIYADDVKCSHGSTTGQINDEAIFYLRARGISENIAKKMVLQAFAADVLEHVHLDEIKELLLQDLENILH